MKKIKWLKIKGKTSLPNSDYVEAKYPYISIYMFVNDNKPEKNIIVKYGNDYFAFEGSAEKVENVITWADQHNKL